MATSVTPFMARMTPASIKPDPDNIAQGSFYGFICMGLMLMTGVSGPLMDTFFLGGNFGRKEVVALISGKKVFSKLKYESGVHRVQRVPDTEASGRIHTSAATVAVLPEPDEVDVQIEDKDLKIDVYRASGAGGQHVNTTDSAVRITHLPTGTVVTCQDGRSQHKNKDKAMQVLRARLFEAQRDAAQGEEAEARKAMVGSGDRSERIRTYNFPQGRVTDHRINLTLHRLPEILEGPGLAELIDALIAEDQAKRLAAMDG
mgnify:CR=1 FL=1